MTLLLHIFAIQVQSMLNEQVVMMLDEMQVFTVAERVKKNACTLAFRQP